MLTSAHIGLSFECNMKCVHCFSKNKPNIKKENSDYEKIVNALSDAGVIYLIYTHGEPLLNKSFYYVANLAKLNNFYQILMTNGWFLQNDTIIEKLIDSGINRISISLDSSNPMEHDKNRGIKGAWDKAINSLKLLSSHKINRGISFTIREENIDQIDDLISLSKELKVNFISLTCLRKDNKIHIFSNWDNYIIKMKEIIMKFNNDQNINIFLHDYRLIPIINELYSNKLLSNNYYEELIDMNSCHSKKNSITIDPNGDVYGCNFVYVPLGNIHKKSLKEILENDKCIYQC